MILSLFMLPLLSGFSQTGHEANTPVREDGNYQTNPPQELRPQQDFNLRLDQAIQLGLSWMANHDSLINLEALIVFSYLERKFMAPAHFSVNTLLEKARSDPGSDFSTSLPFLRLVQQTSPESIRLDKISDNLDRITSRAIWADHFPLPDNYLQMVENESRQGGYFLTHTYLALVFMKELGHPLALETQFAALEKEMVIAMLKELNAAERNQNPFEATDIYIETVALLLYGGQDSHISQNRVLKILEAQKPDGGWFQDKNNQYANAHTTVLALWALYEYRFPEIGEAGWIVK